MKAEDINVSYEEALEIAPPHLKKKIQHSVELIRKAEKIALMYDPENGFYNTFSGGKDSQALFYIVKMSGVKFQTHMSLTSIDPADVIRFVKTEYPSVIRHKPEMSIFQKAVEKGILPTMNVRWCCSEFKESAGAGKVTLIGIRKEESFRRAKRHEVEVTNRKFSGSLDGFEEWSSAEILRKQKRNSKRKINEDEFSVRTDNEVRCINGKDSILLSPVFYWTEKDVWYFLKNIIKAPHCKLYDEGFTRIGCILCPMASAKQKQIENIRYPHVKRNWIKAIIAIRGGGQIPSMLHMVEHQNGLDANQKHQRITQDAGGWIAHPDPEHWLGNSYMGGATGQHRANSKEELSGRIIRSPNPRYVINPQWLQRPQDWEPPTRIQGRADPRFRIPRQWMQDGENWEPQYKTYSRLADEQREYLIAENIYDWWISGKSYKKWYADKFLQLKFDL